VTTGYWLCWLQWGLLALGIFLFGTWAQSAFHAYAFQTAESAELDATPSRAAPNPANRAGRADATPRAGITAGRADRAGVLGRLEIPRLGITAIVAAGVDTETLGRAVGHIPTTALPGEPGNCALAGHRDTFLRGLGDIRMSDVIRIVTRDHTYLYEVEWTEVVEPERVDVLEPTPQRSVTLVTCYPFHYIGKAPQRFIVRARQVDAITEFTTGNASD
jgi:sortase A